MSWTEFERIRTSRPELSTAFTAVQAAILAGGRGAALSADIIGSIHDVAEEPVKSTLRLLAQGGLLRLENVSTCRCGTVVDEDPKICPVCSRDLEEDRPSRTQRFIVVFQAREELPSLVRQAEIRVTAARIGVITALPLEGAAVMAMLDDPMPVTRQTSRVYYDGLCEGLHGRHSVLHFCMGDMGNNTAAATAATLLQDFPQIEHVIMVGIAGGVPNPTNAIEHVRLGDVVVSNRYGVIQYDFGKRERERFECRFRPAPPDAQLLQAVTRIEMAARGGSRCWVENLNNKPADSRYNRPHDSTDFLYSTEDPKVAIRHPKDPLRFANEPRIFLGPIASSNELLKDPVIRDKLRDSHKVKAVEMESSGIADASWLGGVGYLVIRGICDYCDSHKSDIWQHYAALAAAAYLRCLLTQVPA